MKVYPMKTSLTQPQENTMLYETKNALLEKTRTKLNALMNRRLASAVDLQSQVKQAHWNVKGPNFIGLHKLFDEIAGSIGEYVDLIAERIVQLGGIAEGTSRVSALRSQLNEYPLTIANGSDHVSAVSKILAHFGQDIIAMVSEAIALDDAVTADMCTEISRGVDKWLWFVESHSQAPQ